MDPTTDTLMKATWLRIDRVSELGFRVRGLGFRGLGFQGLGLLLQGLVRV